MLKRGVSRISQSGWDWLYGFGEGKVKRMDGIIVLLDALLIPHNIWTFKRAFPVKFTGPTLNALGTTTSRSRRSSSHTKGSGNVRCSRKRRRVAGGEHLMRDPRR